MGRKIILQYQKVGEIMKIIDRIIEKQRARGQTESITIVCLGDSVTEGCFECYINEEDRIATVFDRCNSYSVRLQQLLAKLYPTVQINVINSGFSGSWAREGLKVLERDVLRFSPDLVIVSYGLNDSQLGLSKIDEYLNPLATIFERIQESGAEIIFLTENYMCTKISPHLTEQKLKDLAKELCERQNSGLMDIWFEKAKEVCSKYNVEVCDLYSVWETMYKSGVNVTELLSNKLNHPVREYHYYIAIKLIEKIMGL